jgi:5-formyltetrahydrofolate cyclo-ligase
MKGMPDPIHELKKELRKTCRATRAALGEAYRQKASLAICAHIQAWSVFQACTTILTYLPMQGEVDLLALLESHPEKNWLVPRIQPEGRMVFHPYDAGRLVRHPFGMLEPDPALAVIPAGRVELALTPGLAYDLHGWRLGYGGGFYDRFLCEQPACISLGVIYRGLLQTNLPHLGHDIPVQNLVTEDGVKSNVSSLTG